MMMDGADAKAEISSWMSSFIAVANEDNLNEFA